VRIVSHLQMQVGGFAFSRNPQQIINIHRGISRGGALPHKLAYDEPKRHLPQDDLGNDPTPAGGQHLAFREGGGALAGRKYRFYGVRRAVILSSVTPVSNCDKLELVRGCSCAKAKTHVEISAMTGNTTLIKEVISPLSG
jgi:hypothetical protein